MNIAKPTVLQDVSVADPDDAHRRISAAGYRANRQPLEIGELPGAARSTYEMHRGLALHFGPAS